MVMGRKTWSRARCKTSSPTRETCPASSRSGGSRTGGAPSVSRASSTPPSSEFFYRYWFRAEVEGIENVAVKRRRLLVSNHSGALPPGRDDDRKAIVRRTGARGRSTSRSSTSSRAIRALDADPEDRLRRGAPANVQRLLYDEEQFVLVFPEGRKGTEKLSKVATGCGASAAAASSRRRCARAHRSCPCA